jgi:conflict system STAND superfamily ATPase
VTTIAPNTTPLPEIPYRGIESLRFVDQRVFCAREEETWDLLSNILINRGVLLYGDSGSGKSSLINAGLIPAAIKENLYAHRLRVQPRRGREIKVERISIETADGPPYLPYDLVDRSATDDKAQSFEISLDEFYEQLDGLRGRSVDEARPLLIFDQFEEFITLFEEGIGQTKDAPVLQQNILNVLTSILQDEELPVKVLFVFREEYLAKLNILFKAAPELLDQYVRLLPPRVEEAEQIILAPFVDAELKQKFATKSNHVRELEGLAKSIATQIQQRSENGFINLTELQIVCRKLWESREPARYFQSQDSDIQKVLEGYWVDALNKLGDLYEPSIALLGHMVTSTNTRNIVSEPDLKFFEKDNFSEDQITRALNALVDSKLVRREPRHKIYFYEIVSEFLVPWIRDKKVARLAQIEANRLAAETRQRLKQVERERRYISIGAIVLGALLLVAIYLGIKANNLKKAAQATQGKLEVAQAQLKAERDQSENLVKLENFLTSDDAQVRLNSVKELIQLDKEGKLPRDLVKVIVVVMANEKNKEISAVASYFFNTLKDLNEVQDSSSEITKSILKIAEEQNKTLTETQSPAALQPRVYFQLASNAQRARANKIADALRNNGFTVPAFDIVGTSPSTNQLRYYRTTGDVDQDNKAKRELALAKIREADPQGWSLTPLPSSSAVRPNHFELWFAEDGSQASNPSPSPSPTSSEVKLILTFRGEDGHSMVVNYPLVTLERNPYVGRPQIVKDTTLTARPGNYILHVQVLGYEDHRAEIVLKGNQVYHEVLLKPVRRPQAR